MLIVLIIGDLPEENISQNHQTHFEDVYFTWGNQYQQERLRAWFSSIHPNETITCGFSLEFYFKSHYSLPFY